MIPAFLFSLFTGIGPILKAILEIGTLIVTTVFNFIVWYIKEFFTGLGVVFHNLSVLTVILAALVTGGWYFKTWDNDKVLKDCIKTCPNPVEPKKYYHPVKRKVYEKVAPSKLITKVASKKESQPFNPFGGN